MVVRFSGAGCGSGDPADAMLHDASESFEITLEEDSDEKYQFSVTSFSHDDVTTRASNTSKKSTMRGQNRDTDEETEDLVELSWRHPTFSDWTIKISIKGGDEVQTYNVHKTVLGVGPKRSSFFADMFLLERRSTVDVCHANNKNKPPSAIDACHLLQQSLSAANESDRNTTCIEMEPLAAEAFPILLDYVYSPRIDELNIGVSNAVALYALSKQLNIKPLQRQTLNFCLEHLSIDTVATFIRQALLFQDETILAKAESFCAKHMFEIPESKVVEILTAVDPRSFLRVVSQIQSETSSEPNGNDSNDNCKDQPETETNSQSTSQEREEGSLRLSLLVAVYGNIHKNELTPVLFNQLTSEKNLPVLEAKAAKFFIELEDEVCRSLCSSGKITSLKERAIFALVETWQDSCFSPPDLYDANGKIRLDGNDKMVPDLPRLRGEALNKFTREVMVRAKDTNEQILTELVGLRIMKTNFEALQLVEESLRSELQDTKLELELLQRTKEELIQAHQKELEELREQYEKVREENERLTLVHQEELEEMQEQHDKQQDDLRKRLEQENESTQKELNTFRTQALKLTSEISEHQKEAALKRDKLKQAKASKAANDESRSVLVV